MHQRRADMGMAVGGDGNANARAADQQAQIIPAHLLS